MKKSLSFMTFLWIAGALLSGSRIPGFAQQQPPQTEEEREKQLQEFIDKEIDRLETSLKLEDWQVFYVDSILNHDYRAMQEELKNLSDAKIANHDLYAVSKDKWADRIYEAMKKIFNDEQWKRYLKSGAEREYKAREKRRAKRNRTFGQTGGN